MDRVKIAAGLVKIAKELMAFDDKILFDVSKNKELLREIKSLALEIHEDADSDDNGARTNRMVDDKINKLARKYAPYYSDVIERGRNYTEELKKEIKDVVWNHYHGMFS
jgi:hypothetical protein